MVQIESYFSKALGRPTMNSMAIFFRFHSRMGISDIPSADNSNTWTLTSLCPPSIQANIELPQNSETSKPMNHEILPKHFELNDQLEQHKPTN